MQEDFLHYVWQFQKFSFSNAETATGLPVTVTDCGTHNLHSGPDFFNGRLKIGDQLWAGNVEIHINSSDWYVHGHETDPAYDNVILHVVWKHDADVFRKDNSVIPVLELKDLVDQNAFQKYEEMMSNSSGKWINCENDFPSVDSFEMDHWLERLYVERLEEKSKTIFRLLEASSNNWEEVLFKMMFRSFGLNVNGEAFLSIANSIPFSIVRKMKDQFQLEALFLGQAGLLEGEVQEAHFQKLQQEYLFLKKKFKLNQDGILPVRFFRLRPDNFPNIRLVQLAALYSSRKGLFSEAMRASGLADFYELFRVQVPEYWESHYTFEKVHHPKKKPLTENFVNLVLINTVIPLKFCYNRKQAAENTEEIFDLVSLLKKEANQVVVKFNKLRRGSAVNALQSQALLQLKQHYCDKNRCLKCSLGVKLLQRNC